MRCTVGAGSFIRAWVRLGLTKGLGQGFGYRVDLVWELAMCPGGGADSHWGTRNWGPGRPPCS